MKKLTEKLFDKVMFMIGIIIAGLFAFSYAADALYYYTSDIAEASIYAMLIWFMVYCMKNLFERIRD